MIRHVVQNVVLLRVFLSIAPLRNKKPDLPWAYPGCLPGKSDLPRADPGCLPGYLPGLYNNLGIPRVFTRANAVWIYTDCTLVFTLGNSKVGNTVFTLVITLVKSRVEEKSYFLGWFSPEDQKNVPHSNMCVIIYVVLLG